MKSKKENEQVPVEEVIHSPEPDFLKQYRACYPRAKKFYVTGDNLVFPDNPQAAESHQKSVGKGELKTY